MFFCLFFFFPFFVMSILFLVISYELAVASLLSFCQTKMKLAENQLLAILKEVMKHTIALPVERCPRRLSM